MVPNDHRRERRSNHPRRRPERIAVEGLETRQLMTYSPFGYSLPQLSVTGFAASSAAWDGPLAVDITVENQGASSLIEPLHLAPSQTDPITGIVTPTPSTADAPATTVQVFASTRPNSKPGQNVQVGVVAIPSVTQNSSFEAITSINLPSRPKNFPSNGGKIYLTFVVDNNQAILQSSQVNNIYHVARPVRIANPLPDLQVVALDIASPLQPGDVITPTVRIANFGAADPGAQGPVTVELVASQDQFFGPGDSVVGSFVINSLPGVSGVASQSTLINDANVIPPANTVTHTFAPIKLPTTPGFYYLGIVIDPLNKITETYPPSPALRNVVTVGPADAFLPSANLLVNTSGVIPVFPALPSTVIAPPPNTNPVTPVPLFPTKIGTTPIFYVTSKSAHSKKK